RTRERFSAPGQFDRGTRRFERPGSYHRLQTTFPKVPSRSCLARSRSARAGLLRRRTKCRRIDLEQAARTRIENDQYRGKTELLRCVGGGARSEIGCESTPSFIDRRVAN